MCGFPLSSFLLLRQRDRTDASRRTKGRGTAQHPQQWRGTHDEADAAAVQLGASAAAASQVFGAEGEEEGSAAAAVGLWGRRVADDEVDEDDEDEDDEDEDGLLDSGRASSV